MNSLQVKCLNLNLEVILKKRKKEILKIFF